MREFPHPLKGYLQAGLRHLADDPPGTPGLVSAKGLRMTPAGLRAGYAATVPSLTASWPYPQLFPTYQGKILAVPTALYSWSGPGGTPASLISGVTTGGPWSLYDGMTYVAATNGSKKVSRSPSTGLWATNTDAKVPLAGVFADFNGQMLAGELPGSWCTNCGTNWVAWARPGTADFTVGESNLAGQRPTIPWMGKVQALRQLGEHVMAYGESGVCALMPMTSPAPGFGLRDMDFGGIAGRLAVTGLKKVHYFVDANGDMWRVTDNHEILFLGYREFFSPLMANGISMSMNAQAEEVIISGSDRHYLYSHQAKALSGPVMQAVSGAAFLAGALTLVGPATASSTQAEVVTDVVDFGRRALNTLTWVEVVGNDLDGLEVAVDYRTEEGADWTRTSWQAANSMGLARVGIMALEFRVCARFTPSATSLLTGINTRWQASDKRFARGSEGINWGVQQGSPV